MELLHGKSRAQRGRDRRLGLGVARGLRAELLRRLVKAGVRRSGEATAAQVLCAADRGEAAARVRMAARVGELDGIGFRGVRGALKRRWG